MATNVDHMAEAAQIEELRERLNVSLAAAGAAGSWDWDIVGGRLFFDGRMAAIYGIDAQDAAEGLPTRTFFSAIEPSDVPRIRIAVAGMLHGAEVFHKSFRIRASDGSVRWVEAHGRCHYGVNDEPERFSGILVDVTGRRRVEERLRVAQTAGGVGTFEHVPGFATATVSEQFCRLLGLNPAAVLPVRTINRVVCEGQSPLLNMEASSEEVAYAEICITRADDGEQRWVARRGEAIEDADGAGIRHVGVIYDITETKRAEEALRELNETLESRVEREIAGRLELEDALRQAQKMEAVGQLTGGIAHDFNNLLTVIMGNLDIAVRRLGATGDERIDRALANALKGAERATALTQRLLAFSRRQPLDPKQVNIARLLHGMSDLLGRTMGETIHLHTEVAADVWPVEVDPNQLENVIINLAVNARDAMDGEGDLSIRARNHVQGAGGSGLALDAGDYVVISVTDTGGGMADDTIARAFEPFFTTKEVGKGTGLGLSMVYGFIRQSGGDVEISSRLGEGTTLSLYLPRLAIEAADAEDDSDSVERGSKGEAVLVVEDDEQVRSYAAESLRDLGYEVIDVPAGAAALDVLKSGQRVDLILTDVIMPGMSGRELADAAKAFDPAPRLLYMSGYPRDVIVRNGRLEAGVELLSKPFNYSALAAKVREVLDA